MPEWKTLHPLQSQHIFLVRKTGLSDRLVNLERVCRIRHAWSLRSIRQNVRIVLSVELIKR